jgi:hypothetical protein
MDHMKMSEAFPSKWLKAADLAGDTPVTIKGFKQGKPYDDGKPAYELSFVELDKTLGLNRTNWKTIEKLHGEDTDDWTGKRITVYPTEVEFQGEQIMGIRVRLTVPKDPHAPAGSAGFSTPPLALPFGAKGAAWLEGEMSKQPTDQASMLSALRQHLTVTQPALASVAAGPVEGWPKVWKPVIEAWLAEGESVPF